MADLAELADLESTPEYQALVVAAAGKPERAMGESVIPAEPPQWSDVLSRAQQLLQDPPHLAVLIYIVKANAHLRGFNGLQESLDQTLHSLTSHWDAVQPLADPDDEDDPHYARVNFLRELSEDPAFANMLYRYALVDVRGVGAFSARDIDIAKGIVSASEEETERCKEGLIRGAMQETGSEALRELSSCMLSIVDCCKQIDVLFDEHAGSAHGLSMARLAERVSSCHALMQEMASDLLDEAQAAEPAAEPPGAEQAPAAAAGEPDTASPARAVSSRLGSREEAAEALAQIIAYYRVAEPSSPIPILAERAREMIPKSFFQIVQELAPAAGNNFAACLESLRDRPMASLLDDSFQRYIAGESQDANLSHSGSQGGASIDSRSDVIDTLNQIDLFFTQTEPASPIPLIIAEMKKMVQKTFTQLVSDFYQSLCVDSAATAEAEAE